MNTIFSTAILSFCQRNQINHIDAEIIVGLKSSDSFIRDFYVKRLFYKELRGLLSAIQYSLFKGRVEYDELVNELYVYLSQNNWAALDTYRGDNKARLNSWLSKVAWRFFMNSYRKSSRLLMEDAIDYGGRSPVMISDDEIRMDIESVLRKMPNRRYAEILKLNLHYGYTAEELSVIMDTTVSNVYNLKHRAVMQFLSIYGQKG